MNNRTWTPEEAAALAELLGTTPEALGYYPEASQPEPVAEPVAEPAPASLPEPVAEPVAEPVPEPVAEAIPSPQDPAEILAPLAAPVAEPLAAAPQRRRSVDEICDALKGLGVDPDALGGMVGVSRISEGQWRSRKRDDEAAKAAAAARGAAADRYIATKCLVPESCASYAAINTAINKARAAERRWVRTMGDLRVVGVTINPATGRSPLDEYLAEVSAAKTAFAAAVAEFCDIDYPALRVAAAVDLGQAWDPSDWPPVEKVRQAFALRGGVASVLRRESLAGVPEITESVRESQERERREEEATWLREAAQESLGRILEALRHVEVRAGDGDKNLRADLFNPVARMVEQAGALNPWGSPEIDAMIQEAAGLVVADPTALNQDDAGRAALRDGTRAQIARVERALAALDLSWQEEGIE